MLHENAAVSYIGDIYETSIATQVQSVSDIRFLKCENQDLCGVISGKELQLKDIDFAKKEWHRHVARSLGQSLLCWFEDFEF